MFIGSLLISFLFLFKFLISKIDIDTHKVVKYLISNGTNNSVDNFNVADILNLSSTDFMLQYSLGIKLPQDKNIIIDEDELEEESVYGDYLEESEEELTLSKEPLVYIYNTHQTEAYEKEYLEAFNIKPTVLLASYMLRENLNNLNIPTIVETDNVTNLLNAYGWKYGYSYKVSRMLLEDAKKANPTLKYFIDLHRDAGSHARTTTTINNKPYAKVLFVVGLDHDDYEPNLKMANEINSLFDKYYQGLSRGVITKSGKGVNGVYNQDFDDNVMLIEVGGQYNTIEEVNNTINAVSDILFKYIRGEENEEKGA